MLKGRMYRFRPVHQINVMAFRASPMLALGAWGMQIIIKKMLIVEINAPDWKIGICRVFYQDSRSTNNLASFSHAQDKRERVARESHTGLEKEECPRNATPTAHMARTPCQKERRSPPWPSIGPANQSAACPVCPLSFSRHVGTVH